VDWVGWKLYSLTAAKGKDTLLEIDVVSARNFFHRSVRGWKQRELPLRFRT